MQLLMPLLALLLAAAAPPLPRVERPENDRGDASGSRSQAGDSCRS